MTVRLRAHHLLCLLTWAGKGYSPAFTAGFTTIATRIAAGEAVVLVEGPDDVCAPMLDDPDCHCRGDSVARRDAQAARDVAALLGRPLSAGQRLVLDVRFDVGEPDALVTDRVEDTVDYGEVCQVIALSALGRFVDCGKFMTLMTMTAAAAAVSRLRATGAASSSAAPARVSGRIVAR